MLPNRLTRRAALAAGSVAGVSLAAACAAPSQPGGQPSADDEYNKFGPITYVQGKDTSGNLQNELDAFNQANPKEKVTLQELPEAADLQRSQMVENAENKSDAYTVLGLDVVWTAEFAGKQYIDVLPEGKFSLDGFLKPAVDTATYFNKQYCVPLTSNGALLFYRSDLYEKAGLSAPPKTWEELQAHGEQIKAKVPEAKSMSVYGGQWQKYEGLTCNFSEFVNGAGGVVVGADGKPNVSTAEAAAGLQQMVAWLKSGIAPKAVITWQEEPSKQAFLEGKLIFLRNWPYVFAAASATDGSSKVAGKFKVAPIPGKSALGVSTLGGRNLAINKYAKNKGTAVKFIEFMTKAEVQKNRVLKTTNAPTLTALYSDPELIKAFAYLPVLLESVQKANPRPKAVKYGDVTLAIQDAAYSALQGQKEPVAALTELQAKLEGLIKV